MGRNNLIMSKELLNLAKKFISIESTADNQKARDEVLELALSHLKGFAIDRFENNGVKSALIYRGSKRPKKFKIILNGHLDVVPGKKTQYSPEIKGNRLYGVGSMDMKANVACIISVFKDMADKVSFPLGLQLVTDEEIGGFDGTKYQVDKGVRADFVIAAEPTNFNIANKAKGVLWLKVSAKGKTAHGAYPWRGKNAILMITKFLDRLYAKYPTPKKKEWVTTVNLSRIETSNQSFNKIPDDCEAWLDIRYIPEDSKMILEDINKLLPKGLKLDIVSFDPSLEVEGTNKYIGLLQKSVHSVRKSEAILYGAQGSSDARHFTEVGCSGVEFGPIGGGIGTDHEWVDIKSLGDYCKVLKNFFSQ